MKEYKFKGCRQKAGSTCENKGCLVSTGTIIGYRKGVLDIYYI